MQFQQHSPLLKLYLPCLEHPDIKFQGLIIGPRGTAQRRFQDASGCILKLRGSGSQRNGGRSDGRLNPGDYEPLHVRIEGGSVMAKFQLLSQLMEICAPRSATQARWKEEQLMQIEKMRRGEAVDQAQSRKRSRSESESETSDQDEAARSRGAACPSQGAGVADGRSDDTAHRAAGEVDARISQAQDNEAPLDPEYALAPWRPRLADAYESYKEVFQEFTSGLFTDAGRAALDFLWSCEDEAGVPRTDAKVITSWERVVSGETPTTGLAADPAVGSPANVLSGPTADPASEPPAEPPAKALGEVLLAPDEASEDLGAPGCPASRKGAQEGYAGATLDHPEQEQADMGLSAEKRVSVAEESVREVVQEATALAAPGHPPPPGLHDPLLQAFPRQNDEESSDFVPPGFL